MNAKLLLFLSFLIIACQAPKQETPTKIPAGTFLFNTSIPAGQVDENNFLPYIGNFGKVEGLSVLVLSKRLEKGKNIIVKPLGTLLLEENHAVNPIIVASPIDTALQLTKTQNFRQFLAQNAGEKQIIQDWFLYQKGLGKIKLVGWKDERHALQLIGQRTKQNE